MYLPCNNMDVNHGQFQLLKKITFKIKGISKALRIPWTKKVKNADTLWDLNIWENLLKDSVVVQILNSLNMCGKNSDRGDSFLEGGPLAEVDAGHWRYFGHEVGGLASSPVFWAGYDESSVPQGACWMMLMTVVNSSLVNSKLLSGLLWKLLTSALLNILVKVQVLSYSRDSKWVCNCWRWLQ